MDSLYNVPVQTLRGGTHTVLVSQTLHHHDVWIVETTSNQAPGLIFSQLYIELLSRKNG